MDLDEPRTVGKPALMLSLLLAIAGSMFAPAQAAAQTSNPPGPDRYSVTVVDYTEYFWWLAHYAEDDIECEVVVDHEGLPTPGDIYVDCGQDLYEKWLRQKPCGEVNPLFCDGLYLHLVDTKPAQKEVSAKLPPPIAQVTLENCAPVYSASTSICDSEPILVLTGTEPLPDYQIISIEGLYEGQPFICDPICRLQLPVTDEDGFVIQFWANSGYGDSSEMFDALVRVSVAEAGDPDRSFWYADVLSDQWVGGPLQAAYKPGNITTVGGAPEWLTFLRKAKRWAQISPTLIWPHS
jgi:hypothetical protein